MADDDKKPQKPGTEPAAAQPVRPERNDEVTENPGEGTHMFTDWAVI